MKTVFESIPESVVSALGWTLLHSVWQGTLLAAIAFAAFFFLRRSTASLRYNVGIVFLSLQVIISVVTFTYYQQKTTLVSVAPHNLVITKTLTQTVTKHALNYDIPFIAKVQIWLNIHLYELVICWLIGACLLMIRFAGGWIYTEHLRSKARLVMDKEWRVRFGMLTAKLNISQSVEFRETARILTPMVIGTLRPVILIPLGFLSGFSTSQIEAILAHELAHIRRNDYLVNMLQSLVEVVFFFHPALWWLSEKIRTEREHCCDDIALTVCEDKMALARALVKVAEWQSAPYLAMAFASKKPLLLQRITRVMGVASRSSRPFYNIPVVFLAIGLIAGISFYAVGQQDKKQTKRVVKTIKNNEKFITSQQAFSDTIIKGKESKDASSTINVQDYDKRDSLAQAYHKIEGNIIGIGEIRSSLNGLSSAEIDMLSAQLPALNRDDDKLSAELEKLTRRLDELNLLSEKLDFETERFQRKIEKLDWKKDQLTDSRNKLIEKRASLFDSQRNGKRNSKNNVQNLSESELEKQLEDFEQQIKAQEQQISEFNSHITSARKEADAYEDSDDVKNLKKEIEDTNRKIDEIGAKIGLDSFKHINYTQAPPTPPKAPKTPKKVKGAGSIAAPPAPPAKPKAPGVPPAPPAPPVRK